MSYVLIIGAKSDIAKAVSRQYAQNGYNLYLAGRNINEAEELSTDIKVRSNVKVELKEFNIGAFDTHQSFYDSLNEKPLGVIVVSGYMADQKVCEENWLESLNTMTVNYTGAVSILNTFI